MELDGPSIKSVSFANHEELLFMYMRQICLVTEICNDFCNSVNKGVYVGRWLDESERGGQKSCVAYSCNSSY